MAEPGRDSDDFRALRLERYLNFTTGRHPDLASRLDGTAANLHAEEPQEYPVDGAPILLDAECATMGDAGFVLVDLCERLRATDSCGHARVLSDGPPRGAAHRAAAQHLLHRAHLIG